jgi:hypothetical protein
MNISLTKISSRGSRSLLFEEIAFDAASHIATDVKRGILPVDTAHAATSLKYAQEHPECFAWGPKDGAFNEVVFTPLSQ